MPHVILKLHPGRSERIKEQLVGKIVKDVAELAKCEEKYISMAIEEVSPDDWPEKVYKPDILDKAHTLYKKPGYNPFE
jgi:4-oxalocrotonate tautomerase